MRVFWSCPMIVSYWQSVLAVINEMVQKPIALSPKFCLLGLVEELAPMVAWKALLSLLLFYARKAIMLSWRIFLLLLISRYS